MLNRTNLNNSSRSSSRSSSIKSLDRKKQNLPSKKYENQSDVRSSEIKQSDRVYLHWDKVAYYVPKNVANNHDETHKGLPPVVMKKFNGKEYK